MTDLARSRWAAIGAAVAITLGAGGVSMSQAAISSGEKPVFVSLSEPCRLVDTRPGSQIGVQGSPIAGGAGGVYEIQVTGGSGECTAGLAIPADAVGVALNVTAIAPVAPSGRSFFTVYPGDAALPGTSNLNFTSGQAPTANKVDVGLSATGTIKIYNNEGTAHAAVDVFGYYVDHNHDGDNLWAVIRADGTTARGSNVVDSTNESTGTYRVNFNRDISQCAYAVSDGDVGVGFPDQRIVGSATNGDTPNGVFVQTFNFSGTLANGNFHVIVMC